MKSLITFLGILFVTAAQGQNSYWAPINSGTSKQLLSVSFGNPQTGYISGADSLLLKTTDGGITWSPVSFSGLDLPAFSRDIIHINFINPDTGFAITSDFQDPVYKGSLYKTTDGGATWTGVNSGNIAGYSTFLFDEDNGYEVGSAFFSGHTLVKLSGGSWVNYQTFNYAPEQFLYTVDFHNTNTGIAGGTGGYVYRTFDAGVTWDTVKTVTDSAIRSLKFVNDSTILAASDDPGGALIVSTDTGKTWQHDMNTLTFFYPYLKSLTLSGKDSFVTVGRISFDPQQGVILSWSSGAAFIEATSQPMNSVAMRDDSVAFAVGDSGLIMSNLQQLVNIHPLDPGQSSLHIYPNPTRGKFMTQMDTDHEVTVYDLAGRSVCTTGAARRHHIDLSAYTSGLYILSIRSGDGKTVYTKLLKE